MWKRNFVLAITTTIESCKWKLFRNRNSVTKIIFISALCLDHLHHQFLNNLLRFQSRVVSSISTPNSFLSQCIYSNGIASKSKWRTRDKNKIRTKWKERNSEINESDIFCFTQQNTQKMNTKKKWNVIFYTNSFKLKNFGKNSCI